MSNDQYLAGGWEGTKGMIQWNLSQSGLTNLVSYDPHANSTMEFVLGAMPVLSNALKISDYGHLEGQRLQRSAEKAKTAEIRLSMPDNVKTLKNELNALSGIKKELLTEGQQARLQELKLWNNTVYKTHEEMILRLRDLREPTRDALRMVGENSRPFEREWR